MARTPMLATWRHGFKKMLMGDDEDEQKARCTQQKLPPALPSVELITSSKHNSLGINKLRTFPTLYNGTSSPHGVPEWWKPKDEVDVLICGDKSEAPLLAGRADGVQPRFLEILHSWGLASEVAEEGPIIERTAIYKDGQKLFFGRSHQSDSRYRGLHVITQGQIERIYVRDLLRHQILVERGNTVTSFKVEESANKDFPVEVVVRNEKSHSEQIIRAKFLVGSDGAASSILISSKHGGCVIIPREDGYIRLYTQLDVTKHGDLAKSRATGDADAASQQESGGAVAIESITPEEVLEQANRIFAPYKLKFAAPLSWFAIWKSKWQSIFQ
nr:aromatic hydroxylase fmpf [Quercus suber]